MTGAGERPPQRPETTALTAGRSANGPSLATPLWATSTFEPEDVEASLRLATTPRAAHFYSRHGNPTVRAFEEAVAALGVVARRSDSSTSAGSKVLVAHSGVASDAPLALRPAVSAVVSGRSGGRSSPAVILSPPR